MKNKTFVAAAAVVGLFACAVFASAGPYDPPAIEGKSGFFLQVRGGASFFPNNQMSYVRTFNLYDEIATVSEAYEFRSATPLDFEIGGYVRLGGVRLKAGLGYEILLRRDTGSFTASLPHPTLYNTPRTVTFDRDDMENKSQGVVAFALFGIVDSPKVGLWLGPIFGLGFEKITSLGAFVLNESAPFDSASTTISDLTFITDAVTSPWYGLAVDFEYALGAGFGLVVSSRFVYDNPVLANLGKRANFLQIQASLGLQIVL
jgi:hypothetical protein